MRPSLVRWFLPVPGSFLLQLTFGSFYAIGIFASRLSDPSLTYGLGAGAWAMSASLTYTGIAITGEKKDGVCQARRLARLGAFLLSSQLLIPIALTYFKPLLYLSTVAMGIGYGMIYVVSLTVLQAWVPDKPGSATGAVLFAGGVGTLTYVAVDSFLVDNYASTNYAVAVAGVIQSAMALFAGLIVFMPPTPHWHPRYDFLANKDLESEPLLGVSKSSTSNNQAKVPSRPADAGEKLSVRDILLTPSFYVLLIAILAGVGPGFGVILHGSRMQTVLFGVTPSVADERFFFITLVGVASRLMTGITVDSLAAARKKKFVMENTDAPVPAASIFSFDSAKSVLCGILIMQSTVLALAFPVVRLHWTLMFPLLLTGIYVTFSAASVLAVCMYGFALGRQNSTLSFSLIGVPLGLADFLMSMLVGSCAALSRQPGRSKLLDSVHDYDDYFLACLIMTGIGLMMASIVQPRSASKVSGTTPSIDLELALPTEQAPKVVSENEPSSPRSVGMPIE